ncbi:MAG: rod shape-determining protein MreD [Chloroflexota bacterium]
MTGAARLDVRYVMAFFGLAILAVLQVSLFSRVSLLGAAPQLVLLAVIAWSILRGPVEGMYWGFAGGLLYDLASGGPVGVSALAMVAVAAAAGLGGKALFSSNVLLPILAVFAATIVYVVVTGFLLATLHYPMNWRAAMADVAVPTAIANSLLGLLVYPFLSFVDAHTSGQIRVGF